MSENVYVVTTGSYSDLSVHSVWADKTTAEAYADRLSESDVLELPLRTALPETITVHVRKAQVVKGEVNHLPTEPIAAWEDDLWEPESFWRGVPRVIANATGDQWAYVEVRGIDPARVGRVFQDKVAEAQARQAGVA